MEERGSEPDFAVAARTRIEGRNRERERKAARRSKRESILLWLCAPLLLPAAGAALATWVIETSPSAELPLFIAAYAVPLVLTVWLARRRGWFERIAWPLVTLAATVAFMFWVGFVWLGYGPD
jgi:FtsH-binding integral membrane protein